MLCINVNKEYMAYTCISVMVSFLTRNRDITLEITPPFFSRIIIRFVTFSVFKHQ